jgi:hypothetical protein
MIEKAKAIPAETLLKTMGYHNPRAGRKTLESFLRAPSIYTWLKEGHFDFKYDSETFLGRLAQILEIPADGLKEESRKDQERLSAIAVLQQPSIFVNTRFRRKNEPSFALALREVKRNLPIDKEAVYEMSDEVLQKYIGSIVQDHYAQNDGKLPLWGTIRNYLYRHTDGRKLLFGPDGKRSHYTGDIVVSKAELTIGGKPFAL